MLARSRRVQAVVVVASALVSGAGSYVLLIIVAKAVSTADYGMFAVFWAIATVIGLGVYFPIEQETARDFVGRGRSVQGGLRAVSFGFGLTVSAVLVAVALAVVAVPGGVDFVGSVGLVGALCVAFLGYFVQFPIRGLFSGARFTDAYALVLGSEGLLRVIVPAVLLLFGASNPTVFALAVGVAAAVSAFPWLFAGFRVRESPARSFGSFASRASRLIVAALVIQVLINSSVLLARVVTASDPAFAGQLLSCLAIARIPVFLYQVLQVLYMPDLASAWKAGRIADARRTVAWVAGGTIGMGVITVSGMLLLGPWAIGMLFTPQLVLATGLLFLLTVGVALFLLAQALSDATLACGGHSVVLATWLCGAGGAAVTFLLVPDPSAKTVLPLITGSLIACLCFGVFLVYQLGRPRGSFRRAMRYSKAGPGGT